MVKDLTVLPPSSCFCGSNTWFEREVSLVALSPLLTDRGTGEPKWAKRMHTYCRVLVLTDSVWSEAEERVRVMTVGSTLVP